MDFEILKSIFGKEQLSISELIKNSGKSSYSCYATLEQLKELAIVTYNKGQISIINSPTTNALKQLVFSNFDSAIFGRKTLNAMILLLNPKTISELSVELELSYAQTNKIINKIAQFLDKTGNMFVISKKFSELINFLRAVKDSASYGVFWESKEIKLLKIPKGISFEGNLTAFSKFSEYGIQIETESNYVVKQAEKLSIEQILVHAIKFSKNANDLLLCILFYLKNKENVDIGIIEKESKKFQVIEIWIDVVSWLDDLPVKNHKLFLPRKEFEEKASLYSISIPKRFELETSQGILKEAEQWLRKPVKVFLIGGSALMEYGLKNSTKDMDLVVENKQTAEEVVTAFEKAGFGVVTNKSIQYEKLAPMTILEKQNAPRIDLFVKNICNCLEFSTAMVKRSKFVSGDKLKLFKASVEDVFLLKSVSSRDSDLIDSANILTKQTLNWRTIAKEIKAQEKNLSQLQEITIIDHFEAIEERLAIKIPIKNKIIQQALRKSILFTCKIPKTVQEIRQKLDFPEYKIRNTLTKLIDQKKIKRIKSKPIKFQIID